MRLIQKNDVARPSRLLPRFDGAILSLERNEALWDSSRERPTTHAFGAAIQRYSGRKRRSRLAGSGIDPKTVSNQRKRATVEDMKTGPAHPRSSVLTWTGDGSRSGAARARHWTTAVIGVFGAMAPRACRTSKAPDVRAVCRRAPSHRDRRGADSGGQAPPVRRHRPDGQVRGRPTRCDGGQKDRMPEAVPCRVPHR